MTKVLVIPDLHLKISMLDRAEEILRSDPGLRVVLLGDYLDDFYATKPDYDEFMKRLLQFRDNFPEAVFLWGNHEISYLLNRLVTGNAKWGEAAAKIIERELKPKFVHIDGKVIFSHAGVFDEWLSAQKINPDDDPEKVIKQINQLPFENFWRDDSPIWARPQHETLRIAGKWLGYKQVVGHTPMQKITDEGNIISTDAFSTNWGKKYGEEGFIIIDTKNGGWTVIS